MTLKFFIGLASFSIGMFAILLNLLIFIPVFRLAFVSKKSTIYIIAFFNIISDLFQLFITGFHLSASIMADRYVLSGERFNDLSVFLGFLFCYGWYLESLVQMVMAANRFVVITLKNNYVFTVQNTMILFVFVNALAVLIAMGNEYLLPCCQFIADHEVMAYTLNTIEGIYPYTNLLILLNDIVSTVVSIILYILIFNTIRTAHKTAPEKVKALRAHQDIKYLFHFVFISIFYIFTWVSFEVLPFIVPVDQPQWFGVIPCLVALNCSSNPIIYLTMNREVQKLVPISWIRERLVKGASSSAVNPSNPKNTKDTTN